MEANYFDSISFQWNGKAGASISIRFNCLSTDFSRIKGVKGIPLRLHMDNRITNGSPPACETSFCRIKLFRDKVKKKLEQIFTLTITIVIVIDNKQMTIINIH